jgi:hypothetical protein
MTKKYTVIVGKDEVELDAEAPVEAATLAVEKLGQEEGFSIGLIISVTDTNLLKKNKRKAEDETVYFLSSFILSNASMHSEARILDKFAKSLNDTV